MKNLLTFILLTSISLCSWVQKEVFHIDSIPTQGILLDKGWKWHAGDNSDWAKSDFNDNQWETINPTWDIMNLKQLDNVPIFWLRLPLKVDSNLQGKTFALSVKQTGASQFFLNGKRINEVGHVSTNPAEVRGYDPMGEPIAFPFFKIDGSIFGYPICQSRFIFNSAILSSKSCSPTQYCYH